MTAVALLMVRSGGRRFALELAHLVEVLDTAACYAVPAAEPALRGLMDVRGRLLPLVHLGALLEGREPPAELGEAAVLVRAGGREICLEVDEAETVAHAEPVAAVTHPGEWARGVVRDETGLVPLLDVAALVTRLTERGVAP